MEHQELIPHLFRTEFSRITSVLCRKFGIELLETAEDIASETFLLAIETWPYRGIPSNPIGWLHTVARNKTRNHISRNRVLLEKVAPHLRQTNEASVELDFSDNHITDSQLQMLFALCHPVLSPESQIALSLRILCGFGVDEISNALLSSKDTINKRLFRAKEKLRAEKIPIESPGPEGINSRLSVVLATLYLLFNEGYYSELHPAVIRKELCLEAMRLVRMLTDHQQTNLPEVKALFSLMCFHSSRLEARRGAGGNLVLYDDQDETRWNRELISRGIFYLRQASVGNHLSKYHLEAGIAYWHTQKSDIREKWEQILRLYDLLVEHDQSPVVLLNRIVAVSRVRGSVTAIQELEKISTKQNQYYFALLGELYKDTDRKRSVDCWLKALSLAKTAAEKNIIQQKISQMK